MLDEAIDVSVWSTEVGIGFDGAQLRYTFEPVEPTDTETKHSASGVMTLHHEWNRDRTRLRRLVVEGRWHDGPSFIVEARRPSTGWVGDELGRLLLAVLTFGYRR